ncbi:serpin family protein [Planococcus sp. CAU13]|uniref:serpin family protein n=1 Tax=Planococcus sp. CAU13 TaxID=1541197 RepID=UPI00068EAED6|nr:serpin family protein [Planococcus sp. CAU13]
MKKLTQLFIALGFTTLIAGCGSTEEKAGASMKIADGVEYGETDYKQIAEANNILGMKLLKDLSAREDGNIFVSPTSLYMALAMVYNGADGVTKEEIAKVLETEGLSPDDMNRANASLIAKLASDSGAIELNIANSIWAKDSYQYLQSFRESSQDYFNAEVETMDITDPASAKAINEWVDKETNGRIDKMVESPLSEDLAVILLNAIYFNGTWQYTFIEKMTEEQPFYPSDGSTTEVPLMVLEEELAYMETDQFQAVALPYGEGEMNMHVFLPAENSSLDEFKSSLDNETWSDWMKNFESREGLVKLPKFELEYEVNLNETLQDFGMETAFNYVDLSRMFETSNDLFISEVKQKTFVNVSEEGTEAAAVTSVAVDTESATADEEPPFELIVNRPFFFAITDEETGVILFMGSIENPV